MTAAVAGILVGGKARRMGGIPKGLLAIEPGRCIVQHLAAVCMGAGLRRVLVGNRGEYDRLGLERIEDAPPSAGPLSGLVALLRWTGGGWAVLLACDMPFLSPDLVGRLVVATTSTPAAIVAPRRDDSGVWEPLFAAYRVDRVLPIAERRLAQGHRSMQCLIAELGAQVLPLSRREWPSLADWDCAADCQRSAPRPS